MKKCSSEIHQYELANPVVIIKKNPLRNESSPMHKKPDLQQCYVILIQKKTYVHTFIFWIGIPVGLVLLVAEEQEEDWKMGTSYL